ncbi:MAG TPA: DUF2911 domain-containing protein [Gemmatimonadaceae bacterium]|nr:DUF2911 domain-containing protein [Gemmatimonadaceae bacterium]
MRGFLSCLALMISIPFGSGAAQGYPFSQRGSVLQNVAFTEILVTYGRPVARGRVLFGQLVPWDSVWHPGADSATTMTFNHDVMIEGQKLEAGEYTLWLVPRQSAPWTLIMSHAVHVFHKPYPGSSLDALRVPVTPERLSHMETLAIYFPLVLRNKTIMRIHWGETAVSVHIEAPYQPPLD